MSFAHNLIEYIPNIFDAESIYTMGSVDFSYNRIGKNDGKTSSVIWMTSRGLMPLR